MSPSHTQGHGSAFLSAVEIPAPETNSASRMNDVASPRGGVAAEHRLVPLGVWLAVLLTLLLIPLKIISGGYLPPDDGLRHAAKAVAGREWGEIMVIQEQFRMDHNPGWHAILGGIHHLTGADAEALALFGVCALALLVLLTPLGWLQRPEAWVAALLGSQVAFSSLIYRTFVARPFAVSIGATVAILLLWRERSEAKPIRWKVVISTLLFALGTWIHGSWYLFILVPMAFALAARWRAAAWLSACWLAGAFLGALLTGHPIAFLWNAINIGINCFGHNQLQRMLVGEFVPSDGAYPAVLFTGLLLTMRTVSGRWSWKSVNNPIFLLAVLGWILGLRVIRFWVDWGLPALALWTALEFQEHFRQLLAPASFRRLAVAAGLCVATFFALTSDLNGRWTSNLTTEYLSANDPEMAPWLPEDGGIIYNSRMGVFYDTFFKNPHAKWRYILGFESTFMPPDDLKILRNIQWNYYAPKAHQPWVAKMRPQDRMVILSNSATAPSVDGLEWKYVARETWIGRLPKTVSTLQ